ncbi:putative membrane protein [Oikeobacillus pervagus]|uniref:Membrane protein n=1 Tax=Oikeobacillus pervagus TaxID=1325931 RepID=A0AAJ1WL89_9BACI|nr:phage holin family protein [Oikeobacillus pervagus]MDQ0215941.1 putative membrane protein [Oikeobacillus pervagus]
MRWLISILLNAVLFLAMAGYFEGVYVSGFGAAVMASILLSILNLLVKPILIIFTLPATILTLGLFLFVINALTLLLTDSIMGDSFNISGFGMALLMAVLMSLFNVVLQNTILSKDKR